MPTRWLCHTGSVPPAALGQHSRLLSSSPLASVALALPGAPQATSSLPRPQASLASRTTSAVGCRPGLELPSSKPPRAGPAVTAAATSGPCRAGLSFALSRPGPAWMPPSRSTPASCADPVAHAPAPASHTGLRRAAARLQGASPPPRRRVAQVACLYRSLTHGLASAADSTRLATSAASPRP